jgi:hypothetical protein
MMRTSISPLVLGLLVGCGGGGGGSSDNPAMLWLANDMVETRVKLVDAEPPPF